MAENKDIEALRTAFEGTDLNGDGFVSRQELRQLLEKVTPLSSREMDVMFDKFDTDNDGKLNFDEFFQWLMQEDNQATVEKANRKQVPVSDVYEGMEVVIGKGPDEGQLGEVMKITGSGSDRRYRVALRLTKKSTWTGEVLRYATAKEMGAALEGSLPPVCSPLMAALSGGVPAPPAGAKRPKGGPKGGPKGCGKGPPPPPPQSKASAKPEEFPEGTSVELMSGPQKGKFGQVMKITGDGSEKKYRVQIESGGSCVWVDKVASCARDLKPAEKVVTIEDFYEVEKKKLGTGAFGSVSRAKNRATGLVRALKNIRKPMVKNVQVIYKEIEFMRKFDHPNIIKLYDHFEDARSVYLIMELCNGGELFDRIIDVGAFGESEAACVLKQILRGLNHMHCKSVMHRDLKPENFLLVSKDEPLTTVGVKIIDFGISHDFPEEGKTLRSKVGSCYYVAPEVLRAKYTHLADMWSFGVIAYITLCGSPPFPGETDGEVEKAVLKGDWGFTDPIWEKVSDDGKDFIRHLMVADWEKRLDAPAAMEHCWIHFKARGSKPNNLRGSIMGLKAFQGQSRMKKFALQVLANQCSDDQLKNLREEFQSLDKDGDGMLTLEELRGGMARLGLTDNVELQEVMRQVDFNNSGKIDYTEFLGASLGRKLQVQEDVCWGAFRVFDKNGDGKINKDEIAEVLKSSEVRNVAYGDIDKMIEEVDRNQDGEVDFDEFIAMMRSGL